MLDEPRGGGVHVGDVAGAVQSVRSWLFTCSRASSIHSPPKSLNDSTCPGPDARVVVHAVDLLTPHAVIVSALPHLFSEGEGT